MKLNLINLLLVSIIQLAAFNSLQSQNITLIQPVNLDFENGNPGELPLGWHIAYSARERGYTAGISQENAFKGRNSFMLEKDGGYIEGIYGSVMQSIDAKPYRGKKVRFRAAVRAEITSERGSAHLWIREHFIKGDEGKFIWMEDSPIVLNEWQIYEVEMEIEPWTGVINYGLLMWGSGKSWIDNASLELIVEDSAANEKAAPLSDRNLSNLVTFADIFGFVRYFHPSKEAQETNWDSFALNGVAEIMGATNDDDLSKRLNQYYGRVAPGIAIYESGNSSPSIPSSAAPQNALNKISISWIQNIAGLEVKDPRVSSKVVNVYESRRESAATVLQTLDIENLAGLEIEFSSWIRAQLEGPESQAQLWMRIDNNGGESVYQGVGDNFQAAKKWENFSIRARVPDEAKVLRLGLVLVGDGKAWFDNTIVRVYDGNKLIDSLFPKNNDFETGIPDEVVRGWVLPNNAKKSGYLANNSVNNPQSGRQCLLIESDSKSRFMMPEPGEVIFANAGENHKFALQISIYLDSLRSLPYPDASLPELKPSKPESFVMNLSDRDSRLAIVVLAWNFFRHFATFESDSAYLKKALVEALRKAAIDDNDEDFRITISKLMTVLKDSQARAWIGSDDVQYGLPLLWTEAEGKVIVSYKLESTAGVEVGDEIISIDGKPIKQALNEIEVIVPGASKQWKRLVASAYLRSGKANSKSIIELKDSKGIVKKVELSRDAYLSDLTEARPKRIDEIAPNVLYIDLTRCSDKLIIDSLAKIESAKAIIFDARGLANASEHTLSLFISRKMKSISWKVPQITKPDMQLVNHRTIESELTPAFKAVNASTYFLVDERSVGYIEAVLGLVKFHKIGTIIGNNTAGTAGEVVIYRLPGNLYISVTGIKGYLPDGTLLHGSGIQPDVPVFKTVKSVSEGRDLFINKALELINKLPNN